MDTNNAGGASAQVAEKPSHNPIAALSYLGILVIIPLLVAKDDPYVKFHVKQGIVLLISFIIGSAVMIVPVLGWIAGMLLYLMNIVLLVMGVINSLNGEEKELPLIGGYAAKLNF
ncbi:MAG: DUF4870 domain-containing protein [Candidatus Liptonbacteria bacterium]